MSHTSIISFAITGHAWYNLQMDFNVEEVPGKEISITEKEETILTYYYGVSELHSHFHPLYTPNGQVITRAKSEKHPQGLCFALGAVYDEYGKQIQLQRNASTLEWENYDINSNNKSIKFVCNTTYTDSDIELVESCNVVVHPINNNVRILEMTIVLQTGIHPIKLKENFGLGYFAAEMEHRKTANSDGRLGEIEVNQKPSEWVTLCGITENTAVGLAIIPHPTNGQTIFYAEDAYQGYLLAQTIHSALDTHATLTLNYRVVIYVGDLFTIDISDYYEEYAQQEIAVETQ